MDEDLRALLNSATLKATDVDGHDVLLLNLKKGTAPAVWQRLREGRTRSAEEILSTAPEMDEDEEGEEDYLANLMSGEADLSKPPAACEVTGEEAKTTNIGHSRLAAPVRSRADVPEYRRDRAARAASTDRA